jgi:hypothetical protein
MTQTAPPSPAAPSDPAPSHPTLGLVAQILGVLGAVVCAVLIVGVLMGKSWVQERVDHLAQGAVEALDSAIAVSGEALTGLATGATVAAEVRTTAEGIAASPTVDEVAFNALEERLSPLAARYQEARDRYVVLREKATDLMDTVQRLDRLLPGISLPEGPVKLVAGMDEKLADLDAAITGIATAGQSRAAVSGSAAAIAEQVAKLEQGIAAATELTQRIQTGLTDIQGDIDSVGDKIGSLIGISSIAAAIILAWGVLLHVALWALGRRWRAA